MKGIFERTKFIDMCMARFFRVAKKKKISSVPSSVLILLNVFYRFLRELLGRSWKTNILRCILIQGKVINRECPQTFNFKRKSVFFSVYAILPLYVVKIYQSYRERIVSLIILIKLNRT